MSDVITYVEISASYAPPPPEGFISPMTWGVEDHVRDRFWSCWRSSRPDQTCPGFLHGASTRRRFRPRSSE